MAKTVSSAAKAAEREKEKAEKARQKEQLAAEKEKVKQQKEAERAAASAAKAAKAAERALVEAEREKLRREKDEARLERERLAVEREKEKVAREKEKGEKEKEKTEKEKAKKEKAQEKERLVDRSRNLLSSFLGVAPKPAATEAQPAAASPPASDVSATTEGNSDPTAASPSAMSSPSPIAPSCPSPSAASPPFPPQPLFHPFQLKPNSTLAPLHRLLPATADELDYLTQQLSHSSSCPSYPSLAPHTTAASSAVAISHSIYTRSGDDISGRGKRRRSVFYERPSRRNKLIQHHKTFRPPFYGYLPTLPTALLSACRPFAVQSAGVNYDVDSDEEWGEEPEGEELGEDEDEGQEDEGEAGKEGSAARGQLRRDGYEEDGDFMAPEDEDEALLMGGSMAEARVMERGGKKRVVIRPIVIGPWHTGEAISAEVAELRKRTQWKWCRPLTREVVKRVKNADEEKADKAQERKASETSTASSVKEYVAVVEERAASTTTTQLSSSGQSQSVDCFTPPVKKKVKRTIVPQLTFSAPLPPHTPSAATAVTQPSAAAPSTDNSLLPSTNQAEDKPVEAFAAPVTMEVVCSVLDHVAAAGVAMAMDVVEVEVEGGGCVSGLELEESDLELTTELSCSETGTSSDLLTSELSTLE